jgi:Phage integrase family
MIADFRLVVGRPFWTTTRHEIGWDACKSSLPQCATSDSARPAPPISSRAGAAICWREGPETGNPLDRSRLLKRFKVTAKRAGIREMRFHDLRHTFGTRMAAAGVALRTLQEWMGHRDFKTTLIYAAYQPGAGEAELVERAFGQGAKRGAKLSESAPTSRDLISLDQVESGSADPWHPGCGPGGRGFESPRSPLEYRMVKR